MTICYLYVLAAFGGSTGYRNLINAPQNNARSSFTPQLNISLFPYNFELPKQQQQTAVIVRLKGQNEAGGRSQSMSAFPNLSP